MTGRKDPHELAREVEGMLAEVQGVQQARLTLDRNGEISEVHVVADATRRGKELVRDIETVLKACFDFAVDHRRISVARVGEDGKARMIWQRSDPVYTPAPVLGDVDDDGFTEVVVGGYVLDE